MTYDEIPEDHPELEAWRNAIRRLFEEINNLEDKILNLELELNLIRTKPRMDTAGEEYWEHG